MLRKLFPFSILAAVLLSACSGAPAPTPSPTAAHPAPRPVYGGLFTGDSIHDIRIDLSPAGWEDILAQPTAEEYHPAAVTLAGVRLENVGFRTKGNSTLRMTTRSPSQRFSFRVKFDKYEDDQTLFDLDEMVLNNGMSDRSYLREYLTYEAFRALGVKVPLTAFFNLFVNGELRGFYLGIEAVDDSLLDRFFGNHKSTLYKADTRSTLKTDMPLTALEQKNGKDESKSDLARLIQALNDMPLGQKGEIESILDVDSALKYLAVNAVLGNEDSYLGRFAHNYYLCSTGGIFTVIPWDYNMSLGTGMMRMGGGSLVEHSLAVPVFSGVALSDRPLAEKLLAVPEYLQRYLDYCDRLAGWLAGLQSGRMAQLAALVRPYVEKDPTQFFTLEEFDRQFSGSDAGSLAGFAALRAANVKLQVASLRK